MAWRPSHGTRSPAEKFEDVRDQQVVAAGEQAVRCIDFKAVVRLFNKFTQSTNEPVMDSLNQWMFSQIDINGIGRPENLLFARRIYPALFPLKLS